MSLAEAFQNAGATAGVGTFLWTVANHYQVSVKVTAQPERLGKDGIKITVTNRSRKRSVTVEDLEVLHRTGLFKRVGERAGPHLASLPWDLDPDETKSGWIPLDAVDGSKGEGRPATYDFKKPVKVRARLQRYRDRTSWRVKIGRS